MNSRTGLLLSEDLIFISRIVGTAGDLGLTVHTCRTPGDLLARAEKESPSCVLVDLQHPGLAIGELVGGLRKNGAVFVVGYGSHVDTESLKQARAAGCDLVLPRSKFVADLPVSLPEWFVHV